MRALEKDFLREVQHSKSRFLSIFILAALAVAFLSGLRATAPDMKRTLDTYMDEAQFMDVQVLPPGPHRGGHRRHGGGAHGGAGRGGLSH